jgi:hypothetical protein
MKTNTLITLLIAISSLSFGQNLNIYQKDFLRLDEIIQNSHPANDSIKSTFQNQKSGILNQLESCDDSDHFQMLARRYIANLHDGHSSISWTRGLYRRGYFPIRFKGWNNKLFMKNCHEKINKDVIGKEIAFLNDVDVDILIQKARPYFSFDNEVDYMRDLYWLNTPVLLGLIDVDAQDSLTIRFKNPDISPLRFIRDSIRSKLFFSQNGTSKIEIERSQYYKKTYHPITGRNGKLFTYEILKPYNTCHLNFQECVDKQYVNANKGNMEMGPAWLLKFFWSFRGGDFSKFLNRMFKDIYRNNIDNLIIDLRSNRGGTSILGYQLLDHITNIDSLKTYTDFVMLSPLLKKNYPEHYKDILKANEIDENNLTLPSLIKSEQNFIQDHIRDKESHYYQPEPTRKFKGTIYVLIGGITYSSATNIATLFADNDLAIMVGSQMGMNPTQYGEVLNFELPNTKTRGRISCKKFVRPAGDNVENKINFDYELQNSIADDFFGRDPSFDKLLQIIMQKE